MVEIEKDEIMKKLLVLVILLSGCTMLDQKAQTVPEALSMASSDAKKISENLQSNEPNSTKDGVVAGATAFVFGTVYFADLYFWTLPIVGLAATTVAIATQKGSSFLRGEVK